MNKHLLSGLIGLLLLALVSHATAEQFTFEVPIVLRNLHPEIDSFLVNCNVYADPLFVANTSQTVALPERNYTGTLRMTLNVLNPASIRRYTCTMSLNTTRSSGYLGERLVLETYGRDPSAPMAFQVEGDIPPGGHPQPSTTTSPDTQPTDVRVTPLGFSVERDTDRPGSDFFSTPTASLDECSALCEKEKRCRVFTYFKGNCWLKNSVPATKPLPGATSGVRR
jgi:hypothetical protein